MKESVVHNTVDDNGKYFTIIIVKSESHGPGFYGSTS